MCYGVKKEKNKSKRLNSSERLKNNSRKDLSFFC